ncbi:MAG: TrkH family potassium uptake protein [Spirochaetaceae bacterium]|jgi:trk system potassium uptake protein TrkH|nr:TrkH family potassium uptake protein [Spirochaetaceae bacterium]
MKRLALIRLLAIIFGVVALLMLPSLFLALAWDEFFMLPAFLVPLGAAFILALPALLFIKVKAFNLRPRDGFLLVFLTWVLASLLGSIPYYLAGSGLSFTDSFFESACGFATTGSTTIGNIEALPRALLLWRSTSHWAGGMGIILLTVAFMPLLGVGGFQLIKAEAPGPEKEKLTPRIAAAAKSLWGAYCVLTAALAFLYRAGGMDWFDAVCHSLTTTATGGVSTKNAGMAYYNSPFIDRAATVFMILSAINFNMYYRLVKRRFRDIAFHTETRAFLLIFFTASLVIALSLLPVYGSFGQAWRYAAYQAASILSTTGSVRADYSAWPSLAQGVLFCLMLIGGCSGSTAGGVKVIRVTVLFKQCVNEIRRVLFPQGVFSIQLNKKVGRKDVVYGVAGFIFLYMAVIVVTTLVTAFAGFDLFSSFSAAVSITCNVGTGFGRIGPGQNFAEFPGFLKWFYSLVMISGRLELWTVFILFTPEYWRS